MTPAVVAAPVGEPLERRAAETRDEGQVRYEGLVTRAIAFSVDAAVVNVVAIAAAGAVALALSVLDVPDWVDTALVAIGGVLFVAWSAGYFIVFWSTTGQTPGSRLMRIVVRRADDGGIVRARTAAFRVVCLMLAAIPLLLGFASILFDARRRGLHDMLAGTVVVREPELTPLAAAAARRPASRRPGRETPPVSGGPPPPSASA